MREAIGGGVSRIGGGLIFLIKISFVLSFAMPGALILCYTLPNQNP